MSDVEMVYSSIKAGGEEDYSNAGNSLGDLFHLYVSDDETNS